MLSLDSAMLSVRFIPTLLPFLDVVISAEGRFLAFLRKCRRTKRLSGNQDKGSVFTPPHADAIE